MSCVKTWREFHDLGDVAVLIRELDLRTVAEAESILAQYYDLARYPAKARYLLEELIGGSLIQSLSQPQLPDRVSRASQVSELHLGVLARQNHAIRAALERCQYSVARSGVWRTHLLWFAAVGISMSIPGHNFVDAPANPLRAR